MVGAGGEILLTNAVKDGFFIDTNRNLMSFVVPLTNGETKTFSPASIHNVTESGFEFIRRYADGSDIDS